MKNTIAMPTVLKIMICGPMTGQPDFNRPAFHEAAEDMRQQGFIVYNPATLPDGWSHSEYMNVTLGWVNDVDALYLLDGWENSEGALLEFEQIIRRKMPLLKFQSIGAFRAAMALSPIVLQTLVVKENTHAVR